jgi:hypothetical protein
MLIAIRIQRRTNLATPLITDTANLETRLRRWWHSQNGARLLAGRLPRSGAKMQIQNFEASHP